VARVLEYFISNYGALSRRVYWTPSGADCFRPLVGRPVHAGGAAGQLVVARSSGGCSAPDNEHAVARLRAVWSCVDYASRHAAGQPALLPD
jgi:hypothetical protein